MTAPVDSMGLAAFQDITARIQAIQSKIDNLASSSPANTTSATTASQFASTLSQASGGYSPAAAVDATSTTSASSDSTGVSGDSIVADAKKYLGVPYVWGGETTSGMDCSGLVQHTYKDLGIDLPRTAAEQQKVGTPVDSLADAQPGDLLFFGKPAYHVAIYLGNNQLIESPEPGKTVHITDVYQKPTSISRIVSGTHASSASTVGGMSAAQLTAAGLNSKVAAYAPQFAAAEAKYSLPSGLLAAVAQQESGGNANAVSAAGAQGLMQLMPATAKGMGVNALDPGQAIDAAGKILSRNLKQFGDSVDLALAAYNAGAGAVHRYDGIPPYTETQNYVRSIDAMRTRLSGSAA